LRTQLQSLEVKLNGHVKSLHLTKFVGVLVVELRQGTWKSDRHIERTRDLQRSFPQCRRNS